MRAQDDDEERHEDAAGEQQHELADPFPHTGEEQSGAGDRRGGGEEAPGAAQGDGALERDDGAEEAEHHQRPVQRDHIRAPLRQAPTEAKEPGPDAAEEGCDPEGKQRETETRRHHCCFILSL